MVRLLVGWLVQFRGRKMRRKAAMPVAMARRKRSMGKDVTGDW